MRNYSDITIERGALHVVNARDRHLGLTEAELDLGDGVGEFLATHVERGLADPQATAARFIVGGADRASGVCQRMLTSASPFVADSAELARLLYQASENDERVSDGALAVLRCDAGGNRFVAIIKLDPSNAYRAVEERDGRGRARVRLILEPDILPGVRERVQKCAFVRATDGDDYHMLLVDRQRPRETVSRFFIQDFLGAEAVFDATTRTKALYRALTNAKNDVAAELEADEMAQVQQYLDGQVVGDRINVDDVLEGLPVAEGIRERFKRRIDDVLPDREFDLDPDTAHGFVRRKRFTGDNNLHLTVTAEFYDDMIEAEPPGDDGYWTITIHTREWRQT